VPSRLAVDGRDEPGAALGEVSAQRLAAGRLNAGRRDHRIGLATGSCLGHMEERLQESPEGTLHRELRRAAASWIAVDVAAGI
jgi:hypothetical protein